MPKRPTTQTPWHDLEQQAYHAYREWQVWLVLRERELDQRLAGAGTNRRAAAADSTAPSRERADTQGEE